MRHYRSTIPVSIDIHSDGDEMTTYDFEVECSLTSNGDIDPTRNEEYESCQMITKRPEWMFDSIAKMIEDVAWMKFTNNLDKYEL